MRIGLQQGCPLSTTLFNLYIWDLHQHLTSDVQGAGVKLQGEDDQLLVTDLEYADDATLCASSPQQLQDLINSFECGLLRQTWPDCEPQQVYVR